MNGINYSKAVQVLKKYKFLLCSELFGKKAISNGYVLYMIENPDLQEYIEFLDAGEHAEHVRFKEVAIKYNENAERLRTINMFSKIGKDTAQLFKKSDGRITLVNKDFLRPFSESVTYWQDTKNPNDAIFVKCYDEIVGVVMPMRANDEIQEYNEAVMAQGGEK